MQTQILTKALCQFSPGRVHKITAVSSHSWSEAALPSVTVELQGITGNAVRIQPSAEQGSPLLCQRCTNGAAGTTTTNIFGATLGWGARCRKLLSPPARLKADFETPVLHQFPTSTIDTLLFQITRLLTARKCCSGLGLKANPLCSSPNMSVPMKCVTTCPC